MANNIINLRNLLILFSSFLLNYINKRLFIKLHLPLLLILVTPFTTRAMMSQIFVLKTLSGELRGTYYFLMAGTEGLEPSTHWLTASCYTYCAMPPNIPQLFFQPERSWSCSRFYRTDRGIKVLLGFTYLAIP